MTQLSLIQRDWVNDSIPVVVSKLQGREWSTDDLHDLLPTPEEVNWFGLLIAKMVKRNMIQRVDSKPSRRVEANGRWIGVYVVSEL
jgi:hypothetical protein